MSTHTNAPKIRNLPLLFWTATVLLANEDKFEAKREQQVSVSLILGAPIAIIFIYYEMRQLRDKIPRHLALATAEEEKEDMGAACPNLKLKRVIKSVRQLRRDMMDNIARNSEGFNAPYQSSCCF